MPLSWTIPSSWAISVLVASSTMKSLPIDWTWFWCERKCTHDLWCAWWCTNIPRHWNLSLGTLEDGHLSSEWFQQAIFELQKQNRHIWKCRDNVESHDGQHLEVTSEIRQLVKLWDGWWSRGILANSLTLTAWCYMYEAVVSNVL